MPRQLRTRFPGEMYHVTYYAAAPEHRPQRVRVDRLLGEHGLPHDTPAAQQGFERRMEARRVVTGDEQSLKAHRRGWCLGAEGFKKRMLAETKGQPREHHFGVPRQETPEAKAQHVIREELSRLGRSPADLAPRRRGDPSKLQIAARLRRGEKALYQADRRVPALGQGAECQRALAHGYEATRPSSASARSPRRSGNMNGNS